MIPHNFFKKRSHPDLKIQLSRKKPRFSASEQLRVVDWKSLPPHIVQSFFGYLPSIRDQGRTSLTCKAWHQACREINDHAIYAIAKKFCFFFAPELMQDIPYACEAQKTLAIRNKLFSYIAGIDNPDLRELTKAIIFSDPDRIRTLCNNRFPIPIKKIGVLNLPQPRTEIRNLNLLHLAAIFANNDAMRELLRMLDIKKDLPTLNTAHIKYRKISYNLFDLSLLAENYEILDMIFDYMFSEYGSFNQLIEELSYCASIQALKDAQFSAINQKKAMNVFLEFILKKIGPKSLCEVIPGNSDFIMFYSLLDWTIDANNSESLQLLLNNEYFLVFSEVYGGYTNGPGYDDYIQYGDEQGLELKNLLGKDGSLLRGFCRENIFQELCYHRGDIDGPEVSRFSNEAITLLRALNLAIQIQNFAATEIILQCYQNRAQHDPVTYPHAERINAIANAAIQLFCHPRAGGDLPS